MALTGARGLMTEHEAFRVGAEGWLQDNTTTDFSLFGGDVGFVGFGQIAKEIARLMEPFAPVVRAYDPWLTASDVPQTVKLCSLEDLAEKSRCLFVTAAPTNTNKAMIDAEILARIPNNALLILLSRAHVIDFDALVAEAASGRFRVAIDVFPTEPMPADHPIRSMPNVLLSPHRAAAVQGGRQLIGEMIVDDLSALFAGNSARRLSVARLHQVEELAGTGDAKMVGALAASRLP